MRTIVVLVLLLLCAAPASAGTVICAVYKPGGEVVAIFIPDRDEDCNSLHENFDENQIRLPLSMFGEDRTTWEGKLALASEVQQLVPALVKHAQKHN